jgi:thiosulfate reductase/polysulfide reductase chain A
VWLDPPQPKASEFYLLTGKVGQHTQMGTQNNQLLHKYQDEPRLWMAPDAANNLGLKDWDNVEVTSPVGSVKVALEVTDAIRSDCIYLTPGFGHLSMALRTAYSVGASDSQLHVTYTDPISGGQALSQTFVSVKKA